jgi:hypothetical protein
LSHAVALSQNDFKILALFKILTPSTLAKRA